MPEEKINTDQLITDYVSNTDKDIYTVSNLPEEVIAVIFAYVSRSPKSFRDNIYNVIKEEQHGQERASKFHEKWVLNYGHASVAEHATVHIGIERVSRLFSSILETSNEYLSFTEYSQRYQKPKKGEYHTPTELDSNEKLKRKYKRLNEQIYDIYDLLYNKLFDYLKAKFPADDSDNNSQFRVLEKIAFEDARYVLNLATLTNLGMTANARAMEDTLTFLLSSKYQEAVRRANEIKEEITFSVPTLVKYANENKYIKETREDFESLIKMNTNGNYNNNGSPGVNLLNWTGKESPDPQITALNKLINAILFLHSDMSNENIISEIKKYSLEQKLLILRKSIEKLSKYDNPINVFKYIDYEVEFKISEACWHQLLRHRKVKWLVKEPSINNGITIPPNIVESGLDDLFLKAINLSEEFYNTLHSINLPVVANYVVTNAHNRCVLGRFDLWELYHLINLRMSEGAQWDIKLTISKLAEEVTKYHPDLVKPALKRII